MTDEPRSRFVRQNRPDELPATLKTARGMLRAAAAPVPRSSRYHRDSERQENVLVTKMVANTRPWVGIERDETTRAADFRNTNQHLSGQNETGRNGHQQISSAVLSNTQRTLGGCKERSIWFARLRASPCAAPKRWDDRWFGTSERESYNDINGVGRTLPPPVIRPRPWTSP
jgi:hypothetical protein